MGYAIQFCNAGTRINTGAGFPCLDDRFRNGIPANPIGEAGFVQEVDVSIIRIACGLPLASSGKETLERGDTHSGLSKLPRSSGGGRSLRPRSRSSPRLLGWPQGPGTRAQVCGSANRAVSVIAGASGSSATRRRMSDDRIRVEWDSSGFRCKSRKPRYSGSTHTRLP